MEEIQKALLLPDGGGLSGIHKLVGKSQTPLELHLIACC